MASRVARDVGGRSMPRARVLPSGRKNVGVVSNADHRGANKVFDANSGFTGTEKFVGVIFAARQKAGFDVVVEGQRMIFSPVK